MNQQISGRRAVAARSGNVRQPQTSAQADTDLESELREIKSLVIALRSDIRHLSVSVEQLKQQNAPSAPTYDAGRPLHVRYTAMGVPQL